MPQPCDVAAFYWPAYHDEPRVRRFFPQGIGEWETVRQATVKLPGQRQPRVPAWGYEMESEPAAMARKIAAAADHGVNTFIFDWYWYDNQPFLEDALERGFLQAPNRDRLKFYLMWANHDASTHWDLERSHEHVVIWPGAVDRATFDTIVGRVIARYFHHPCYYRIDGKPVFCIYELGTLIKGLGGLDATRDALADFRRRVVAAGLPGLHLQAILWRNIPASLAGTPGDTTPTQAHTLRYLGCDSLTNYQWCHYVRPQGPYQAWGEQAVAAWTGWATEFGLPFFPHVSIGWDNNPRFKAPRPQFVTDTTPAAFAAFLRQARAHLDQHRVQPRLITVNAWNEWTEGSYLEPDTHYGTAYLEAVRDALRA
jgi:hypothetical protein